MPCRCKAGATSVWQSDVNGCPYCYCQATAGVAAAATDGSAAGSGAAGDSSSGVPVYVPVVVALVCLVAAVAAVVAVMRYKKAHGRMPWAPKQGVESAV